MFSHVMVGADDIESAKAFYDVTLGELGIEPGFVDDKGRVFYPRCYFKNKCKRETIFCWTEGFTKTKSS